MQAVILAAGQGLRMRPLTNDRPKQMVSVLGKPIIDHVLELLPEEVSEIILVIGYKGEMLRRYLGESRGGRKIRYVEQPKLEGTYAAVALTKPHLNLDKRFLVIFADDFYDKESVRNLLRHPRGVLVHPVSNPERFGVVILNPDGSLRDIEEKPASPKSNLVATGVYVLDKHFFEYTPAIAPTGEYYFAPALMRMIKEYPMYTEKAGLWIPIGYPEDIIRAEKVLRGISNF